MWTDRHPHAPFVSNTVRPSIKKTIQQLVTWTFYKHAAMLRTLSQEITCDFIWYTEVYTELWLIFTARKLMSSLIEVIQGRQTVSYCWYFQAQSYCNVNNVNVEYVTSWRLKLKVDFTSSRKDRAAIPTRQLVLPGVSATHRCVLLLSITNVRRLPSPVTFNRNTLCLYGSTKIAQLLPTTCSKWSKLPAINISTELVQ